MGLRLGKIIFLLSLEKDSSADTSKICLFYRFFNNYLLSWFKALSDLNQIIDWFSGANINLVKRSLNQGDDTVLTFAIEAGDSDLIEFLVRHLEANVDQDLFRRLEANVEQNLFRRLEANVDQDLFDVNDDKTFFPLLRAIEEDMKT